MHVISSMVDGAVQRASLTNLIAVLVGQDDVVSLDAEVRRVLMQLAAAAAAAASSTALLRAADLARSRMEEAVTTLKV